MAAAALLLLCAASAFSQTPEALAGYKAEQFVTETGHTLGYRVLTPENILPGVKYPLVLFLHGAGERGNDNARQLIHGGGQFLNPVNREKYPCYVLVPQCPEDAYWAYDIRPGSFDFNEMEAPEEPTEQIKAVKALVDKYLSLDSVDPSRVYVMGLSMGGMATYDMVIRYPDLFAAAVPICGVVNVNRFKEAPKASMWIAHGDADTTVPTEGSRAAYRRLRELGATPKYTEFVGCGHNSWAPLWNLPEFLPWLFSQHK